DDYPSLNEDGAVTEIYMKDLVDEKLISTNLVNPKYCIDGECISKKIATCTDTSCTVDDYTIKVTKDEIGKYKYELLIGINTCEYAVNQVVFDEGYSGDVKTFTPKCDGTYKLEVWGAQGSTATGGKGGYSKGNFIANKDDIIYIYIGGQGTISKGGYNGGGSSSSYGGNYCGSGGGATHMAKVPGILSSLQQHANDGEILIVAAGGGGANANIGGVGNGGAGGGLTGGNGPGNAVGATQTSGYQFGQGGNGYLCNGGGGGGYYGGYGNTMPTTSRAGAGGSSYIANLSDAETLSGINTGNGMAKITYIGS
ncbi:MAG: hypothetical protein IJ715_03860, partial [Bacilli bacterium]|nr:hypothetical protein [Bacilli bacterium]